MQNVPRGQRARVVDREMSLERRTSRRDAGRSNARRAQLRPCNSLMSGRNRRRARQSVQCTVQGHDKTQHPTIGLVQRAVSSAPDRPHPFRKCEHSSVPGEHSAGGCGRKIVPGTCPGPIPAMRSRPAPMSHSRRCAGSLGRLGNTARSRLLAHEVFQSMGVLRKCFARAFLSHHLLAATPAPNHSPHLLPCSQPTFKSNMRCPSTPASVCTCAR